MSIVDNFFQDPDKVRDIALSVKYESTTDYPGYRSRQIHEINKDLWDYMSYRLMELPEAKVSGVNVMKMQFSYVPKIFGNGWVHSDSDATVAGAVYLTPDAPEDGGTGLYTRRADIVGGNTLTEDFDNAKKNKIMREFFLNPNEEGMKVNKSYNSNFSLTQRIDNVYNRLAMWNAKRFHAEQNFFGTTLDNSRLVLLYFMEKA